MSESERERDRRTALQGGVPYLYPSERGGESEEPEMEPTKRLGNPLPLKGHDETVPKHP